MDPTTGARPTDDSAPASSLDGAGRGRGRV